MTSFTNTDKTAINTLKEKYDSIGEKARQSIADDMASRGMGAIVWGENLFGSTDYPLFSYNGKDVTLRGFRLVASQKVVAIVSLPDSLDIVGAHSYTPEQVDKIFGNLNHSQGYYSEDGTPEQWSVGADCYKVAIADLNAKKQQKANTWW